MGFDVNQARGHGLGLIGIEERVRELGGRVQINSRPSAGTSLHCEIPCAGDRTEQGQPAHESP
jgi:signal transduction histidine kinase